MKKARKWLLILLGILILAACLGIAGYRQYQSRFAYVGEARYEKTIEAIDLSGQSVDDLTQLQAFPGLKQIDLRRTGLTCAEYDTLRQWFPEAEILWEIPFQGEYRDMETADLAISALTDADAAVLPYFTNLKTIDATQCRDYPTILKLMERYPHLEVSYSVWLGEEPYAPDTAELILTDADLEQLEQVMPFLPQLKSVRFEGALPEAQALIALTEAHPEIEFYWQVTIFDTVADIYTTELDFSGISMTSEEELHAAAAYLPNLTKVMMLDCGLSAEQMARLYDDYPDVLFVWYVKLGRGITVRSDITVFAPVMMNKKVYDGDLDNLRFCTELVVIDLGHMPITDVSFLKYTTEVRFLILADTDVSDLTPLSGLKKLQFLELFIAPIKDYSPLVGCTALEDLNICGTTADYTPLKQMTWLKRLWHIMGHMTKEERDDLRAALPDTWVMGPIHGSTSDGWREGYLYYEMRDLMGMHYMKG